MRIAEHHLGLISSSSSGDAPATAAAGGSWRQDGDLPWALASQLALPALQSGQLSTEQASRVALGACAAIERALRPVLQPEDTGSEPSVHGSPMQAALSTPAFVSGAAALAAQTACSLAEQGGGASASAGIAAATSVIDTLLSACEDCTTAVAELGVGDRASDALLDVASVAARQLLPLLGVAGERDENALQDLQPRLQAVLVRCGAGARCIRPCLSLPIHCWEPHTSGCSRQPQPPGGPA